MSNARAESPSRPVRIALWIVQDLLALTFVGAGIWKVATPVPQLAAMIPWAGQVSPGLLYTTAVFDILGGLGVLLPSATRIKPGLTVLAALGCAALQASAIVFRFSRGGGGEYAVQLLARRALALRRLGPPIEGADRAARVTLRPTRVLYWRHVSQHRGIGRRARSPDPGSGAGGRRRVARVGAQPLPARTPACVQQRDHRARQVRDVLSATR